ncbi:hypothetical protein ACN3XK_39575 [Actinomadura welshii]
MPVTNHQIATLRAQLAGQRDEHLRLAKQLGTNEANTEYAALVAAAFIEAVERRFIRDGHAADESEVVDFVAQVREIDDEMPEVINPQIAESMILHLLEKGTIVAADKDVKFGHQIVLLATLIGQEEFNDAELDAFLSDARSLADQLLE